MNLRRAGAWIRSSLVSIWQRVKQIAVRLATWRTVVMAGIALLALQLAILTVNGLQRNEPILGLRLEGRVIGWPNGDFRKQADAIIREYENKTILVKAADTSSRVTLRQLGADVDEKQLHDRIITAGRTGSLLVKLAGQSAAIFGGQNISVEPALSNEIMKAYITSLNQKITMTPINAYFIHKDKVTIHPDSPGRTINAGGATKALGQINPLRTSEITLPVDQTTAQITTAMLEPLLTQAQAIAQKPLTITAGNSQTKLTPEQLVGLVTLKVIPDQADPAKITVNITFDETKLHAIVDEVIKKAVVAPKPTIMNGNEVVQQGQNGIQAADSHSIAHVLKALIQRQTNVSVPETAQIPLVEISAPIVQQVTNSARVRTGTGHVRLTFDDGPGAHTNQVLDILKRYNVHASFYVIGRNIGGNISQMQRIKQEGHVICNHSFNHPNLTWLSKAAIEQELSTTQAAIQQATGVTPTCFRPPEGAHNHTVRQVAASLGMSVDMWSVDPRDWTRPGSGVIRQRVLNNVGPGAVVLLHTLSQQTVDALPGIIEGIRAQGYTLE